VRKIFFYVVKTEDGIFISNQWKTNFDVDETIVVMMNVPGQNPGLPNLTDCYDNLLNSRFR
jgi:hypothetical protein